MSLLASRLARWPLLALCLLACAPLCTAAQRREVVPESAEPNLLVRVVDQYGAPLPDAEVFSYTGKFAGRAGEAVRLSKHYVREGLTDERGLLEIKRRAERITIACRRSESLYYKSGRLREETEVTVTVLPLPVERVVEGVVLGPEGEPIEGGKVRYYWHSPENEEKVKVATTDAEGRFRILLDHPVATGSLHAVSPPELLLNSKVVSGVGSETAGSFTIQLDSQDSLEVVVKDECGQVVSGASAGFSWWIEGRRVFVDKKERQRRGTLKWERSNVPFFVGVYAKGYESAKLEKVRPDPTRGRLEVVLQSKPRIRIRATHQGLPRSTFRYRVTEGPSKARGSRPKDGFVDVHLKELGTYRVQVWDKELGLSGLARVRLTEQTQQSEVNIAMDQPLGSIDGKILFPPGQSGTEIMLQGLGLEGFLPLNQDDTFSVDGLPPGPASLQLVYRSPWPTVGEDGLIHVHIDWVHPDGSGKAPMWIQPERKLFVDVKPGPATPYLLDLRERPPFQLLGRFELDGKPMTEDEAYMLGRCWRLQDTKDLDSFVTRGSLDDQGRFQLGAWEPGRYRLAAQVKVGRSQYWEISDVVDLSGDSTSWEYVSRTGSLLLDRAPRAPRWRGSLLWKGPGHRQIRCKPRFERSEPQVVPRVPSGRVQVLDSKEKLIREVVIEPGKQTKLLLD